MHSFDWNFPLSSQMLEERLRVWNDILGGVVAAKIYRKTVKLEGLDEEQKETLIHHLYQVNSRVFLDVSSEEFSHRVALSTARLNRIALYRNKDKELVGYCAVHFHDSGVFQYSDVCVVRVETGMLPEYRGRNQNIPFLTSQLFRYKLRHPRKRLIFLGTLVHPSSYALVTKYMDNVWPCHGALGQDQERFIEHLIAQFSFKRRDDNPLVVETGWVTVGREHERACRAAQGNPDIRFFLEKNPEYYKGYGLITVVPFTMGNIATAAWRFRRNLSRKRKLSGQARV